MNRASSTTSRLLILSALVGASPACSLIVDVDECTTSADCKGGLVCFDHACVGADAGAGDAGVGTDAAVPDSGTLDASVGCTLNTECAQTMGAGFVCGKGGVCLSARTPSCANVVGPLDRDNVVLVGSIMPTSSPWESLGRPIEQGMELAVEEINQAGGVTGGRRLVLVQCDDTGSATTGREVAQHLVDLGVPVIFGPAFSGIFIEVTTQVTAPQDVMTFSPSATSPLIAGIEDRGLGWRTAANDTFQSVALADLIRARGYRRLVALGKDDAYGNGLLSGVTGALSAELGETGLYSRKYNDPGVQSPDIPGSVAMALAAMPNPEAVALLGTTETVDFMTAFESGIETSTVTEYLFADGGKLDDMIAAIVASPTLLTRVEGTEPDHQSTAQYQVFANRFRTQFGALPGIYAGNAYDAVYLAAFGLCTLPTNRRVTGTELAGSMAKMVSGRKVPAGPNDFGPARDTLAAGGSIDFDGASGPLDFDLTIGEAPANVALWQVEYRMELNPPVYRFRVAGHYTADPSGQGTWAFNE